MLSKGNKQYKGGRAYGKRKLRILKGEFIMTDLMDDITAQAIGMDVFTT